MIKIGKTDADEDRRILQYTGIFNQYNIIEKINPQRGLFKPDLQSQHGDLDL